MSIPLNTCRRFKARLALGGTTVRGWAIQSGFNPKTVYGCLNGRLTGTKGGVVTTKISTAIKEYLS